MRIKTAALLILSGILTLTFACGTVSPDPAATPTTGQAQGQQTATPGATRATLSAQPQTTASSAAGGTATPASAPTANPGTGQPIEATGLLATVPGYAEIDVAELSALAGAGYAGTVPQSLQLMALVTADDRSYLVLAIDWQLDRFVSAGTVTGISVPLPEHIPSELGFVGGLIVATSIEIAEPMRVSRAEVIADPARYALRRVLMDTTYVFGGARIKDAPEGLDKIGFGQATDALGSSEQDDYLTVVDPYNTESQIRVAQVTGTVLYPTEGVRNLLSELYRFSPDDLREALDRPTVFYESLMDDDAQLVSIGSLVPTPSDPGNKLEEFHGEVVSIEGIALGSMVRTEDVEVLKDMPVHVTVKGFTIADATGAMPVFAVSSEDDSGEVFGHFRVELSIYRFGDGKAFAFLVGMEPVPLDPVQVISDAGFGDPVSLSLGSYTSIHLDSVTLSEDLTITDVDLLIPDNTSEPFVLTHLDDVASGTRLSKISVDGHFLGGTGMADQLLTGAGLSWASGAGLVATDGGDVEYSIESAPVLPTAGPVLPPRLP